jgi:hypothetical protein
MITPMRVHASLLYFSVLCGIGVAAAQTWRIGDDQPFPRHITDLPEAKQQSILRHLEPSLQQRAREFQDEPEEIEAIRKSLLLRRIATPSGSLLLVQGWGLESCGAVGNCALWVLGTDDRLLLASTGNKVEILPNVHQGLPSMLIFEHISASQSYLTWYTFSGSQYRPYSCGVETYSDIGRTYSPPLIERGPCKK